MGFRVLSEKLNPIIKPLVDSIKFEENEQLQQSSARTLARLLELCQSRIPCPNNKILKNVCNFLCADSDLTPRVSLSDFDGILMLMQQQRQAEKAAGSKRNQLESDVSNARALEVQRRGAVFVLKAVATHFGEDIQLKVPFLWESILGIKVIDDQTLSDADR